MPRDPALAAQLGEIGPERLSRLSNLPEAHLWTFCAGYWNESLNTRVSPTADIFDAGVGELLEHLGLADRWDEVEAWYWRTMKSTGERPGTERGLDPPTTVRQRGVRRHDTVARTG